MESIDRIRKVLALIGDIDKDALKDVPSMSPDELLVFGQRLWWLSKRLKKAFEPVKIRLREIALVRACGSLGSQRLEASDGSHALVSIQASTISLRKDADMAKVLDALGDSFGTVFETTVVYVTRKDIQEQIKHLTDDEIAVVMSVVDVVNPAPKVAFKD